MKPTMIFALAMLTLVILMTSFDVHLWGVASTVQLPKNVNPGNVLYVCPAISSGWDSAAEILQKMQKPIWIGVFFALTMLMFAWGWGLYQNLLKDKFNRNLFLNPWGFTKLWFWAVVILLIAINTPNHYRTVRIHGAPGAYVLCENNTPNRPEWKDIRDGKWPKPVLYKNVQN